MDEFAAGERESDLRPAIPRIGLGCANLGNLFSPMSDLSARELLDTAWASGIRYFDTAPHYGPAISEQRLGEFLRTVPRDEVVVSSKVGRLVVPTDSPGAESERMFVGDNGLARRRDYTQRGIRLSVEQSLERLGLEYLDLALVHDPDDYVEAAIDESIPTLQGLRNEGLVHAIGIGTNSAETIRQIMNRVEVDAILCAGQYTLLDVDALALFPQTEAKGTHVVAAGIFNSGILAGAQRPGAHSTFNYGAAPGDVISRAAALWDLCVEFGIPLRAVALAFVARQPAIGTLLLGAGSALELADQLACLKSEIPNELWSRVDELVVGPEP